MTAPPPPHVLSAFGIQADVEPLPGGQGEAFRAGSVVLKPVDDAATANAIAGALDTMRGDGFRVERPIAADNGAWVVGRWTAWTHQQGVHVLAGNEADVLAVGRAFHRALEGRPRPAVLARRTHAWAVADRVAWDEEPLQAQDRAAFPIWLGKLAAQKQPFDLPAQLVHGDLCGNVLFEPGLAPAVIDFSPYWRPTAYAEAIVIADAVAWGGGSEHLALHSEDPRVFPQAFLRAVQFRLVAAARFHREHGRDPRAEARPLARAVDLALRLTAAS